MPHPFPAAPSPNYAATANLTSHAKRLTLCVFPVSGVPSLLGTVLRYQHIKSLLGTVLYRRFPQSYLACQPLDVMRLSGVGSAISSRHCTSLSTYQISSRHCTLPPSPPNPPLPPLSPFPPPIPVRCIRGSYTLLKAAVFCFIPVFKA